MQWYLPLHVFCFYMSTCKVYTSSYNFEHRRPHQPPINSLSDPYQVIIYGIPSLYIPYTNSMPPVILPSLNEGTGKARLRDNFRSTFA